MVEDVEGMGGAFAGGTFVGGIFVDVDCAVVEDIAGSLPRSGLLLRNVRFSCVSCCSKLQLTMSSVD